MDFEVIELHDGNLKSSTVDYLKKTVSLEIDFYPNEQASNRISATFKFTGVSTYSENSNLDEVKKHSVFGNISSWSPASKSGTTYIYLARGFISVTAKKIEVINHA